MWWGEVFTRVNTQARSLPKCRTCKTIINIGTLCLRSDISEIWKDKRLNLFNIKLSPHRFCGLNCIKNKQIKKVDNFQNYQRPNSINIRYLSQANQNILEGIFSDTSIVLI